MPALPAIRTIVSVLLLCVAFAQAQEPQLGGASWRLVKFEGSDDKTIAPDDRSKYTIAFAADGSVSVRIDCNRGHGTWKSSGPSQIQFGPMALTRAFCPPSPLNDRLPRDFEYIRSYVFRNGHLFLSLMADGGIYEFEPLGPDGRGGAEPRAGHVKGTAMYRERMLLPSGAVFEATLEDVSRADAAAEVIGRARVEHPATPIRFEIAYDLSRINPSHSYAVRARIEIGGKLLFTTDQIYPVLTEGHGNEVELLLRRTAGQAVTPGGGSAASLENTHWKLTRLGNTPIRMGSRQQEPHLILNSESRRVSGSGGCNRLSGAYQVNGDQLTFRQMAVTMMACIEGMDTEAAFLEALKQVRRWRITGQQLDLLDASGHTLATLEAVR